MFLKEGSGDARVGELKAELHSRFRVSVSDRCQLGGEWLLPGEEASWEQGFMPFLPRLARVSCLLCLEPAGLIWLLVALFLEGCQDRSPAFPIAGRDHPLAGRQAP